jgi:hypothetical protein
VSFREPQQSPADADMPIPADPCSLTSRRIHSAASSERVPLTLCINFPEAGELARCYQVLPLHRMTRRELELKLSY